jgi:DNA-binding transcriptional ArsR family regulator
MKPVPTVAVAGQAEPAALAARLRVAGWRFARRMRQESDPGITPSVHAALHTVETHGPITAGQLAAHEHVQKPSMTRTIQALLDRGLIERPPVGSCWSARAAGRRSSWPAA